MNQAVQEFWTAFLYSSQLHICLVFDIHLLNADDQYYRTP